MFGSVFGELVMDGEFLEPFFAAVVVRKTAAMQRDMNVVEELMVRVVCSGVGVGVGVGVLLGWEIVLCRFRHLVFIYISPNSTFR